MEPGIDGIDGNGNFVDKEQRVQIANILGANQEDSFQTRYIRRRKLRLSKTARVDYQGH